MIRREKVPGDEKKEQLKKLRKQKEKIVDEIVASYSWHRRNYVYPMKGYSMMGVPGDLEKTNRRYLETSHSLYSGTTNHRPAESLCWNYLRVYYTAIRDPYLDAVVLCVRYYRQTYDHPPPGNPCAY